MHYSIHAETATVTITCTYGDLVQMASMHMAIYATPTPQGHANQLYMASRPQFRYDFLLASEQDFDAAAGYDITAGWQEDEASDAEQTETYTITVPTWRQPDEG